MRAQSGIKVFSAMFFAGFFSLLAQALVLRELVVMFFGNELTFGAMLGFWLIGVSLGSLAVYCFIDRLNAGQLKLLMGVLLAFLSFLLPLQIFAIRYVRILLDIPFGEYVSFGNMLLGAAIFLIPVCLIIGALFPCACQLASDNYRHPVNRVYVFDALGSMTGGALFTFLMVRFMTPSAIAMIAGASALIGAAQMISSSLWRRLILAVAFCMVLAALYPPFLAGMEKAGMEARWRSFGSLENSTMLDNSQLLYSGDSRYQNIALIESDGQRTLYGNGRVMFTFPDSADSEHKIHFIMAQHPEARSILLIGGSPVNDIPELLKYPIDRLLHIELDEKIPRVLSKFAGSSYKLALQDPRFEQYYIDGPRFMKAGTERFDVILVMVPSPNTVALNRFYTVEFYHDVARVLASNGFFYTSLESSTHLIGESADLLASVYMALSEAFDIVMVTAGENNHFFAGSNESLVTLDRETLFERSVATDLQNDYFRPEYFLYADELELEKIDFVQRRLAKADVPANTSIKPVSTFYSLMLWSRFSGSNLEGLFRWLRGIRHERLSFALLITGVVLLTVGIFLRGCSKKESGSGGFIKYGWFRFMLRIVIGSTGCCEMALQIVLIFMFQILFGYVYERIGLIAAVYMLGLMLGAISATGFNNENRRWLGMFGTDFLLIFIAFVIPLLLMPFARIAAFGAGAVLIEIFVYGLAVITGWAGGAQFPTANRVLSESGETTGGTAAIANAADLIGSAIGGFTIGVFLLPLLGIGAVCMLLAALKGMSVLCMFSARLVKS